MIECIKILLEKIKIRIIVLSLLSVLVACIFIKDLWGLLVIFLVAVLFFLWFDRVLIWITKFFDELWLHKVIKNNIKDLNNKEKQYLKGMLDGPQCYCMGDSIIEKLMGLKLVFRPNISRYNSAFEYSLQPGCARILRKNPNLLKGV